MGNEAFDDEKLQNLARYSLYAGAKDIDPDVASKVKSLVTKEKLDNSERNHLLTFIDSAKVIKPKSMTEMKNEILALIGAAPSSTYTNTMSRPDVEAIYNWFMENRSLVVKNGSRKS